LEDPDIKNTLNIHPNKLFGITWSTSDNKQRIFIQILTWKYKTLENSS
jgi:hypothetical protein